MTYREFVKALREMVECTAYHIRESQVIRWDDEMGVDDTIAMKIREDLDSLVDLVNADSPDSWEDERDGDAASALASAGWGTDEDYGGGCENI